MYQEMNLIEKENYWKAQGWTYIYSGATWSGGLWLHDELGTVNQQGGYFKSITEALAAIERFMAAFEQLVA